MVSVVVPAYNEELAIGKVIADLKEVLAGEAIGSFEIIVVDDGSADGTGEAAQRAGATVLRHLQNLGYGRSLKTGIAAAQYDTIVIADGDGTYPLQAIPLLLERYKQGFDMVVGRRTGRHYRESITKMPLRVFLKWLVEFTAGRVIPDANSGLRVFSRATAMEDFPQLSNSFSFTTSITLAYMLNHRFVDYVPIEYNPRIGKTKVRLFRDSLRTLQYIVQAILFYNPLKIFLVLAGLLAMAALWFLAIGTIDDRPTLVGVGLVGGFVSVLVVAMGLLAEQLRHVFLRVIRESTRSGK